MPVSTDEVINEIKVRMRGAEKEWPSAARTLTGQVGHYLSDRQGMTTELGQLEAEMHHLANQRLNGAKLDVQAAQSDFHSRASGEKIATHLQGLLTTVLSQVEFANNFVLGVRAPNKPVRAVTLTGLVPADEFRQIIEKRQPFKDPTVSYGHGEFSHRIQWYCVMKQTGFGKGTSWTDFYSWVGTQKHDEPKTADGPPAWDSLGLWDALVDRAGANDQSTATPYKTASLDDFRSPENLHASITKNFTASLPLLSAFLDAREKKREASRIRNDAMLLKNYVTKKVYRGKSKFSDLSTDEQETIDNIIRNRIL
ncbi:MAG: LirA/MavJ family T4SS effector [Paraburkholderia sp.]|uniref:LirA/MavJ family T4SS effector n=1 Tax=Burkholderiaceae TaxID=119060 RepID=UPI0010F5D5A7|nr:LirA/MavJ family T4SS effector [Burkholderia sp. 4M9327F10]